LDTLYTLKKHDVSQAGKMLTDAFQEDPVFNAAFANATLEQRHTFFAIPVQYSLKYGQVVAPSLQLEGVAAWVPGKYADMTLPRLILSGAFFTGLQMRMEVSKRMALSFRPTDQDRRAHMRGRDYLYLVIIGVVPQYQGQGFGGQLLSALIAEGEQAGVPIYLETETEENVSIYEHFGFEVIQEITLPVVHLPMWEMVREPAV